MSAPNSKHSEERNSHIASLVCGRPVVVSCSSWLCVIATSAIRYSATEGSSAQP